MNVRRSEQFSTFFQSPWLLGLLLFTAVVFAYQPAWHAGFIWDDDEYVTNNPLLTAPDGLRRIWFTTDSPSQYFPLTYTVFRIEHALWGFNSIGYHLFNIFLHAINALLAWRLLKRLVIPGAWLAAAIFALHPVQVESVAWVTELKNVLMCFFFLLALLCWVEFLEKPKPWGWYGLALILYALALCSKTTACTLPAALFLILWLKQKPIPWQRLFQIVPFITLGIGMGLLTIGWEHNHIGTHGKLFSMNFPERVIVATHAIWFYAGKLFWPMHLAFSYPKWAIDSGHLGAYIQLFLLIGLAVAVVFLRRFFGRSLETGLIFYVATLSPVLGFIMLYTFRYTFVADHYQYVASIGLMALVSPGITLTLKRNHFLKLIICGMLLLTLASLTWRQCQKYSSYEKLMKATIAENPNSWMAYDNLGAILSQEGQVDEAIADFEKSLALNPENGEAHSNLGWALSQKGRFPEAIAEYQRALELYPAAEVHNNLGFAFLQVNHPAEAINHLQTALKINPQYTVARYNLGVALLNNNQPTEAIGQFQEFLKTTPNNSAAYNNLGLAFFKEGRFQEAIDSYQKSLEISPSNAVAQSNLGLVFFNTGKTNEAIAAAKHALQIANESGNVKLANTIQEQIISYQTQP